MTLKLVARAIRVNTDSSDEEGRLLMVDGKLVAVLVRLDGAEHGDQCGRWVVEAGFGRCAVLGLAPFTRIAEAKHWVRHQLGSDCTIGTVHSHA